MFELLLPTQSGGSVSPKATAAGFGGGLPLNPDILSPALWRWWRRDPLTPVAGNTTMIIIGLILGALDIGFFCWLLFTLAVYALPFFDRHGRPRLVPQPVRRD